MVIIEGDLIGLTSYAISEPTIKIIKCNVNNYGRVMIEITTASHGDFIYVTRFWKTDQDVTNSISSNNDFKY